MAVQDEPGLYHQYTTSEFRAGYFACSNNKYSHRATENTEYPLEKAGIFFVSPRGNAMALAALVDFEKRVI